jgi:hypothetical protein
MVYFSQDSNCWVLAELTILMSRVAEGFFFCVFIHISFYLNLISLSQVVYISYFRYISQVKSQHSDSKCKYCTERLPLGYLSIFFSLPDNRPSLQHKYIATW